MSPSSASGNPVGTRHKTPARSQPGSPHASRGMSRVQILLALQPETQRGAAVTAALARHGDKTGGADPQTRIVNQSKPNKFRLT